MKLHDWMKNELWSHERLAKQMSESTRTVEKWARGERYPRPHAQKKIIEVTNGLVTADDILEAYLERNYWVSQ